MTAGTHAISVSSSMIRDILFLTNVHMIGLAVFCVPNVSYLTVNGLPLFATQAAVLIYNFFSRTAANLPTRKSHMPQSLRYRLLHVDLSVFEPKVDSFCSTSIPKEVLQAHIEVLMYPERVRKT